jgi:hypothetical protein
MYTLLIYESIPEQTQLFLLPNDTLTEDDENILARAHGTICGVVDADEEGEEAVNVIEDLISEKGVWKKYEQDTSKPILVDITRVIFCGYMM